MTNREKNYDLIIIGAGPAGLSCALEAGKNGLRALVIDKGSVVDSIQHFQRDMFFFSTPELLEIGDIPFVVPTVRPTSLDCVNYYRSVADHYTLDCRFYENITAVGKNEGSFVLKSAAGNEYRSKGVVVATGYYDTPTPLGVPGEDMPHVSHYYKDPLPYYRRNVVIVGGKNSAVEAALDLWRHGARVTVVHRGAEMNPSVKYWIMPDFRNRVTDGSIKVQFNSVVKEIRPDSVKIQIAASGEIDLEADAVFILIGYLPDCPFLKSLGIAIDPETLAPVHEADTMETNVPGLYVAGGLVGGKFNNKVFIENGREHGKNIVAAFLRQR
jgi:thioredoxin reductase (NADPH)